MFLTIVVAILLLSLLIFSHELGHFISAKKAGMKVEEFGFGLPPRIFGIKKGETLYSLNWLPIGGFVKIYGEQKPENRRLKKDKRAFYNKPIWQRAIVIAMGVIMNLVLAAILISILHGIGIPTIIDKENDYNARNIQIQVVGIAMNSPAKEAGIKIGDAITNLTVRESQFAVGEVGNVQEVVARYTGEKIGLTIQRGNEILEKTLIPRVSPPENEGPMGVALAKVGIVKHPWHKSVWLGIKTTGQMTVGFIGLFYQLFKNLIMEGKLIGEIAGPVGIASLTHQMTKLGFIYILQFAAIISINLAIINILPFPALDGGRLLFLAIEKIKGSPINAKIENSVNNFGIILLLALLALVTFRDIAKLF